MNLFDIPGLNGLKTAIGSWTQIICGLLLALVELLKAVSDCLSFGSCAENSANDH